MNFFAQLSTYGPGIDIELHIKEKGGLMTVEVRPQGKDSSKLRPLVLTATAAEVDEGFFSQFNGLIDTFKGLVSNLDDVKKSASAAVKEETDKPAPAKKSSPVSKKTEVKAKTRGKAAKTKPVKKEKAEPSAPTLADMFAPSADADQSSSETVEEDPGDQEEAAGEDEAAGE